PRRATRPARAWRDRVRAPRSLRLRGAAQALLHRLAALGLDAPLTRGAGRAGGDARGAPARPGGERLVHALERAHAVAGLRAALGGDAHDPGGPVAHAHARLGLVLLLPAGPRGLV